jgi:hypothetical protein
MSRIWRHFHPGEPLTAVKFSFKEFVRFMVNGTKEFAADPYVLHHR